MDNIIIPKDTVLFEMECQSCGHPVQVKMNASGKLYYCCKKRVTVNGVSKVCDEKHWFGHWGSQRLIEEWREEKQLEQTLKSEENVKDGVQSKQFEEKREGNDNGEPARRDGGEQGKLGAIIGAIFE